jgi:hypothetical protein
MTMKSAGNCYLCGANLSKTAMKDHLFKFHGGGWDGQECRVLKIEGAYDKRYWLYIDVPVERTLSVVDSFLRRIWLECCGHLSEFFVTGSKKISLSADERFKIKNGIKLKDLIVGERIFHTYDYGSTTETAITVMGYIRRIPQRNIVRLLARNVPPVYKCADCGKEAFYKCEVCIEPFEDTFYCFDCAPKHKDDEHFMFPVTNSPRMGVCAYDGELDVFEFCPWAIKHGEARVAEKSILL